MIVGMNRITILALCFTGALLGRPDAFLRAEEMPANVVACRDLSSAAERLDCYDNAVDRSRRRSVEATTAPAVSPSAPPGAASGATARGEIAADLSREELFGKSPGEVQRTAEKASGNERVDELTARVTGLRTTGAGKIVVKLDNDQVWLQTDSVNPHISEGDEILIRTALLGSYMMQKVGSKRSMRVKRAD